MKWALTWAGLGIAGWAACPCGADEPDLSQYFGFLPVEVWKVSDRASHLQSGDFNHDGRTDLVLIDNSQHRLEVLLQRSDPAQPLTVPLIAGGVNVVTDASRFERLKLSVDHEVAAVTVGDFNRDGRTDLAYFGNPDQLVIRLQPDQGSWTARQQVRVPDVAGAPWCLAAGDLNHDGADDLVVLGKSETIIFYQSPTGTLGSPVRLLNTSDKLGLAQVADLDGDGRSDLCYLAGEGLSRVLGVRLQNADGQLGPEYVFDLERPRSVTLKDVDGKPGVEVLTIDSRTGRLKVSRVVRGPATDRQPDRLVRYGFGKRGSGRDRGVAVLDIDGDGRTDVAVSDPEASQVLVFRQVAGRGLDLGTPYPSWNGAGILRAASGGPGPTPLVVHSGAEKSIGWSQWTDGRLPFPMNLPIDVEPLGLDVVDLNRDGTPEILFLARSKKGRDAESVLWAFRRATGGEGWEPHPAYQASGGLPVPLKGSPERLFSAELTGDDRPELVIAQTGKPPVVLVLKDDETFAELAAAGTPGGNALPAAAVPCTLRGGSGLLVPQENFARHWQLGKSNRWQVLEQFQAPESHARIVGAAVIDWDGQDEPEVALVDAGVKKLRVLQRQPAGYLPWKEIDLGELSLLTTAVADVNSDGRPDLLLFGTDQLAVHYSGDLAPRLEDVATFETQLERTFPTDVLAGDLNADGHVDLVMTDTRSHLLEVVRFRPPSDLRHALYFKVFEEKSFAANDAPGAEPREGLIADVTGDGRNDLVLLLHDRVVVYPQDPGPAAP